MARTKRTSHEEDLPRPPCALCGGPAFCVMSCEVRDLVVDRDAGVSSRAYWTTSYKTLVSSVEMRLCQSCLHENVKIATSVAITCEAESGGRP